MNKSKAKEKGRSYELKQRKSKGMFIWAKVNRCSYGKSKVAFKSPLTSIKTPFSPFSLILLHLLDFFLVFLISVVLNGVDGRAGVGVVAGAGGVARVNRITIGATFFFLHSGKSNRNFIYIFWKNIFYKKRRKRKKERLRLHWERRKSV